MLKGRKSRFSLYCCSGDTWLGFEAVQYENVTGGKLPSRKFYESVARVAQKKKQKPIPPHPENPLISENAVLKSTPMIRFLGVIVTIGLLIWGGSLAIPAIASIMPTEKVTATLTMTRYPITLSPTPPPVYTPTPRFVEAPSTTPTVVLPEFGYTIVDRDEVFSLSPKVKALGELSREKYTPDDRNAINRELLYTIDGTPDLPMFWRWYWCATTKELLNQNMREIDTLFEADGQVITREQLASTDYAFETGWCFTYSTILKDWKPGVYHLVQTTIIKSSIHDGQETFSPGYKKYDFTVKIHSPDTKLDVLDSQGVSMVFVQGSRYKFGNNQLVEQSSNYNIYLDSFYIDKFEVTNALYKVCMNAGNCQPPQDISSRTHLSYYENAKY